MKQSTLHDINDSRPVTAALLVMALAFWAFFVLTSAPPQYFVALLKPCETCEAIPHSVYKSKSEAETKAPKGAIIKELK